MKLTIFTDGASRGNPGPASYGFIIYRNGKIIYEEGKYIGITTNNVAEYTAVLQALKQIEQAFGKAQITLYADSRLVAEQLSGRFKIKSAHLKKVIEQIKQLQFKLGSSISYYHIPRNQNTLADKLANQALDAHS